MEENSLSDDISDSKPENIVKQESPKFSPIKRRPTVFGQLSTVIAAVGAPSLKLPLDEPVKGYRARRGLQQVDEIRIFRAVLGALLVTILLCSVLYFNLLLLGDFFFVYFMAFITSVSLRNLKNQIILSLEQALLNLFSLTK